MNSHQGEVKNVPSFRTMGRNRDRRVPTRFVMTANGTEQEVEVIELHARSVVGDKHSWSGVVRPIAGAATGDDDFAVRVITDDRSGVGTYV